MKNKSNDPEYILHIAKKLAIALADEAAFGEPSEQTLKLLSEVAETLGLQKEFEEIDTLRNLNVIEEERE